MKKLIKKCQYGTPRGGLVPHQSSGSQGDRGQGNELQSSLENGLSWVGDKIVNAGDYIENGLIRLVGFIPGGGLTTEEMLENKRLARNADENGIYYDINGNMQINPISLKAPILPTLPVGASPTLKGIHDQMKKLIQSWKVGERRYAALGRPDAMDTSKTAYRYKQFLKAFNEGVSAMGKSIKTATDDVKLHGKAEAAYRHTKAVSAPITTTTIKNGEVTTKTKTIGSRAFNGRPVRKKYLREIEDMLYKDQSPVAKKMYEQLRLKRAKISDPNALKAAEEKIFKEYAIKRNLTHHLNKLGWIE